jgi:alpha(1,3/1,4) fucosyltransferase
MKPSVRVAFTFFWTEIGPEEFQRFFPFLHEKYDLVPSQDPEVVFYSVFSPHWRPYGDPADRNNVPRLPPGNYQRVFMTGENLEPDMENCEFAITFSALVDHPNHLRLPLWVYENQGFGYPANALVKCAETDWEKIAAQKTAFCNYVYHHQVSFGDDTFKLFSQYKRVDAAGRCLNNMNGWTVPHDPNRLAGKLEFLRRYKFTLALENSIWPGYMTEKLVDPMLVSSIPIYVGDPLAHRSFNTESYIDFVRFSNMNEMREFVCEIDNDRALYLKMLAAPNYRGNAVPEYAHDANILAFFDRIFEVALAKQTKRIVRAKLDRLGQEVNWYEHEVPIEDRYRQAQAQMELLAEANEQARSRTELLEKKVKTLEACYAEANAQRAQLLQSTSWRATAPLRAVTTVFRKYQARIFMLMTSIASKARRLVPRSTTGISNRASRRYTS